LFPFTGAHASVIWFVCLIGMEDYGLGEIKLIDEPPQAAQGTE
jgi:hypothetical protein